MKRTKSLTRKSSTSRSSSRQRTTTGATKTNTLGAKVYTKREAIKKEPVDEKTAIPVASATLPRAASRTLRSSSNQSSSSNIAAPVATAVASSTVLVTSISTIEQTTDNLDLDTSKRSFGLRNRQSPIKNQEPEAQLLSAAASTPPREIDATVTVANKPIKKCCFSTSLCDVFKKSFESGYLCFTIKQLFQIVIASVLLVLTLGIINYLNLLDVNELESKLGGVCDFVRAQVAIFTKTARTCFAGSMRIVNNSVTNLFSLIKSS